MAVNFKAKIRDRLPMPFANKRTLQNAWPDLKWRSFPVDMKPVAADQAQMLVNTGLVRKGSRVLDIGSGRGNQFANMLIRLGYSHALGIDIDPNIGNRRNPRRINFRDLPASMTFDVIHFSHILDYFRRSNALQPAYIYPNDNDEPPVGLLARKIDLHLKPGGILYFTDLNRSSQRKRLLAILYGMGYHRERISSFNDPEDISRILRKPK